MALIYFSDTGEESFIEKEGLWLHQGNELVKKVHLISNHCSLAEVYTCELQDRCLCRGLMHNALLACTGLGQSANGC